MRSRTKKIVGAVIVSLVAGLVAGVILIRVDPYLRAYFFPPGRKLIYSLSVQKMRDGKPYQDPFKSSGQEIFEGGYKFRFNLVSPESGFFYLFNEGSAEDGKVYFNVLYPTPRRNNGSAEVGGNQRVETAENVFGGAPNTEKLWIVWTKKLVPQLETAKAAAFAASGKITDITEAERFRTFLQEHSKEKPEVINDAASRQSTIIANTDVVVSLLYLEHR